MPDRQRLLQSLKQIWGYDQFRYPQAEVIDCLCRGRDCLVVLPTGGGKSLCFQLPALLGEGLTLVVSPLVALMEDQVQDLRRKQLPAAGLHSQLSRSDRKSILIQLQAQQLRLLYLSPETLLSPQLWTILRDPALKIQGLMLDEAHCLVQWGDSFRPAYRRLGAFRTGLNPQKSFPIAAFTATADLDQQSQIIQGLALRQPQQFQVSPFRPQLRLTVKTVLSERCRRHHLLQLLDKHPQHSGLIYLRTRKTAIALAQWLISQGFKTAAYHGGLAASQRRQLEQRWLAGDIPFVVCTNAFGLGINKPDTRWVLHYHPPLVLMDYLQEIGRAGRDLKPATCLTLISEPTGWLDPSDRQRRAYFLKQQQGVLHQAQRLASQLPQQGNLTALKSEFPEIELALAGLHRQGCLQWLDPFQYQLLPAASTAPALADLQHQFQTMTQYLQTKTCRWQYILKVFGDRTEAANQPCGTCDNCLAKN
ncbi:MAG: ATP-dependent DNA helicase RecQ [Synechocystis sp.]|nr:ATP-dependent DNA helicase RecQ [Synechocystis sp.]